MQIGLSPGVALGYTSYPAAPKVVAHPPATGSFYNGQVQTSLQIAVSPPNISPTFASSAFTPSNYKEPMPPPAADNLQDEAKRLIDLLKNRHPAALKGDPQDDPKMLIKIKEAPPDLPAREIKPHGPEGHPIDLPEDSFPRAAPSIPADLPADPFPKAAPVTASWDPMQNPFYMPGMS